MAGSVNQLVFTTYGERNVPGHPPAISVNLAWAYGPEPLAPNIVKYNSLNRPNWFISYDLLLSNMVGVASRVPFVQAIYIDNSKNNADVYVTVNDTQINFMAPAYSTGMYELICGSAPIVSFSALEQPIGPTAMILFAQPFAPYIQVHQPKPCVGLLPSAPLNVVPGNNVAASVPVSLLPGNAVDLTQSLGSTTNLNGVRACLQTDAYGKMMLKNVSFNVQASFADMTAPTQNGNIALVECVYVNQRGGQPQWFYYIILKRYVQIDSQNTRNVDTTLGQQVNVTFDPPYMGRFAMNPNGEGGSGNVVSGPQLGWATDINFPADIGLTINTHCTVGMYPLGYLNEYF